MIKNKLLEDKKRIYFHYHTDVFPFVCRYSSAKVSVSLVCHGRGEISPRL
ncbi:hypothetical protein [Bacteroides finegoldii]|nr:hypothetical protein [Bacteroides finegoldii]